MSILPSRINIQVNDKIYLKNPDTSELGQRIVTASIELIDKLGFEQFTFRKLSKHIDSTEASIYRYFESKHKLLLYLTNWYWGWMEYRLMFGLANIDDPKARLEKAVTLLTENITEDSNLSNINEVKLYRIVIAESPKGYLTKEVDDQNKIGAFASYKELVGRVSDIIVEINPAYRYPHMLVSTVIEGAHLQRYFAKHLPRLTDIDKKEDLTTPFYWDMVQKAIGIC